MDQQLIEKVMKQVSDELGIGKEECKAEAPKEECCGNIGLTEFVGTAIGDTIGLVIASVDPMLVDVMKLGKYRSIGIVGGRTGAGPQIWAVDEAVKATNTEIISVELPRDTKGGAGHGSLIYIGADDVSDARRAVEIALQVLPKYFGDVYGNDAGHLEFQYTARASYCLEKALGAPVAVKAANVEVVGYCSPGNGGTSYSNEVILTFTGDSGAVRQAVKASIEAGKKMLGALGDEPKSTTTPYI